MSRDRIIIFAKAPVPGSVKTRLCPPLSLEEAAMLHDAFVEDMLDLALSFGAYGVTLAYTPAGSLSRFRQTTAGRRLELLPQDGPELGARMHNAFAGAFKSGVDKAALIGTDIPTLSKDIIRGAFDMLDNADAVFAPTLDGGYCLVALKKAEPRLFTGLEWSTPGVLSETLKRAESLGLAVSLLQAQRDVDTPDDLAALLGADLPHATKAVIGRLRGHIGPG